MNPQEQLRDMHTPPPPGWWPPAPGWWLLAAIVLAVVAAGIWWSLARHRRRRYRREALAVLESECAVSERPVLDALQLVRRTARTANPDSRCPGLSSVELLRRLDAHNKGRLSRALAAQGGDFESLAESLYRPDADPGEDIERAVFVSVRHWIRHHRRTEPC